MSAFTDKHKNDLRLLLGSHVTAVKGRLPKYGEAFGTRVANDVQRLIEDVIDKVDAIKTSGRYTGDGQRAELRLTARAVAEKLNGVRDTTVTELDTQLAEQRAAALKPKAAMTDPALALVRELRQRELRDHLRTLDPLTLNARVKQADDSELLDALEGAPSGFSIAPPELLHEARIKIAEKSHPELGELAQLRDAYTYAINVAEQTLLAASGLGAQDLSEPAPTRAQALSPHLMSGAAVPK
jgi:hypothetical protein